MLHQCSISIPPENVIKPHGIEMKHWVKWISAFVVTLNSQFCAEINLVFSLFTLNIAYPLDQKLQKHQNSSWNQKRILDCCNIQGGALCDLPLEIYGHRSIFRIINKEIISQLQTLASKYALVQSQP